MTDPNLKTVYGGVWGLMFIVFFVGKVLALGEFATWSWWWVTAPLWGPLAAALGVRFVIDIIRGLFRMTARLFK